MSGQRTRRISPETLSCQGITYFGFPWRTAPNLTRQVTGCGRLHSGALIADFSHFQRNGNMEDHDGQPRRKRARLACTACNARRVKCNVTEQRPCRNCVAGNVLCETRESRRGKHPRKPRVTEEAPGAKLQSDSNAQLDEGDM